MGQAIARFLSIDKTKLAVFLAFSFIALMFFASPAGFLGLAFPIGGLYYFFLLQIFQISSQLLGLDYYPTLGDTTFSVTLAATAIGYFYLLSSYITFVARRRERDLADILMISSLILVFISPYVILSYQSVALGNISLKHYDIVDEKSCTSVPVNGEAMEWDQEHRTCYMRGNFIAGGNAIMEVADDVTLKILPGGNLTTQAMNNNGTLVVNGGILKNIEGGSINNIGVIDHVNGTFINNGIIENGRYFDGNELVAISLSTPSQIVNRAILENNNYIYNYENFTNLGSVDNSGQIQFFNESMAINKGEISNNGRIEITGWFDNKGEILNSGVMVIYSYSDLTANSLTVLNNSGKIINTVGEINNLSIINNHGEISNQLGMFVNQWDGDKAVINNEGVITNAAGQFVNDGIIKNSCSGVIEGDIQNSLPVDVCDR